MTRPGFVLEVDERTPPLVVHEGEGFRLERFPLGTRVVYGPDVSPGIPDVEGAIRDALLDPVDTEPLPALLRPGMRLTLAFDDVSVPLPPMRAPDVRQRILEQVLELAAAAGVDDVEVIAANSLRRRLTPEELRTIVGERVFRSFFAEGKLSCFDAEDRENLAHLGRTGQGEDVEISRRAAESDLLVYVNVTVVPLDGGHRSVAAGLASYASLRHQQNSRTMVQSRSFMDEGGSVVHAAAVRAGRVVGEHVKVFQIETTLNNRSFPASLDFLNRREWEWSVRDQLAVRAVRRGLAAAPAGTRRRAFSGLRAPYGVTGITAGAVEPVHDRTLARVLRQQATPVPGQSDVLVLGVPFVGPYSVGSVMNPILAASTGLGYLFNSYRGQPPVRKDGAIILYHPVPYEFSQLHHPSYVDFFEEVLAESTDPATLESKFEEHYATDPWYVHLYRTSYAYHGAHPFSTWYRIAHALEHASDVVWVGADRRAVRRLGMRAATTLQDALEMVSDKVGSDPSVTYLHHPTFTIADVT